MIVIWNGTSNYNELDIRYYPSVAETCPQVGQELAKILIQLDMNETNIHCIGHSLGKHFMIKM